MHFLLKQLELWGHNLEIVNNLWKGSPLKISQVFHKERNLFSMLVNPARPPAPSTLTLLNQTTKFLHL